MSSALSSNLSLFGFGNVSQSKGWPTLKDKCPDLTYADGVTGTLTAPLVGCPPNIFPISFSPPTIILHLPLPQKNPTFTTTPLSSQFFFTNLHFFLPPFSFFLYILLSNRKKYIFDFKPLRIISLENSLKKKLFCNLLK